VADLPKQTTPPAAPHVNPSGVVQSVDARDLTSAGSIRAQQIGMENRMTNSRGSDV